MQGKLKAIICKRCRGTGQNPVTGSTCPDCRGIGAVATDGINEFYLERDNRGNLRISDMKSTTDTYHTVSKVESTPTQIRKEKTSIKKGFLLIILTMLYVGFIGFEIMILKDIKVFIVVTIIFIGFLLIYLLSNANFTNKLLLQIAKLLLPDIQDFKEAISNRKKTTGIKN